MTRQDADAGGDDDGLLDRLDVVELHDDVGAGAVLPQRPVDGLADRQRPVEGDEALTVEVGGHDEPATREPVIGMAHDGHRLHAQRHDGERAVRRRVGHDPQVHVAVRHRLHHLVRVQALELDVRLRVERGELLHGAADVVQADGVDGGHAHGAVEPRLDGGHLRLRFLPRLEHRAARLVERLTLGAHRKRALGPIDEGGAHLGLELLDSLAGRGLGNEVLLGAF